MQAPVGFSLPYGDRMIPFRLPSCGTVHTIEPSLIRPIRAENEAVIEALENPIGCPPLRDFVRGCGRITVVVSDITRLWVGSDRLLAPLLNYLGSCGVHDRQIEVIFAMGDHRRHTDEEHRLILGPVYSKVRFYDHDCFDQGNLCRLGVTTRGTEVWVSRKVCEADVVILTGGVTFHLLAGFGGGRKSLVPGVAGYRTIQQNHALALVHGPQIEIHPKVRPGVTSGNPVHEDMVEAARMLPTACFVLNSVPDERGRFLQVVAGELERAHEEGCRIAQRAFGVQVPALADLVVASAGGFPRDISLYQSVKALVNAAVCRDGGAIVFVAECRDGVGQPEFRQYMRLRSVERIRAELEMRFSMPGLIALKAGSVLTRCHTFLVSDVLRGEAQSLGFETATSVEEAVAMAVRAVGEVNNVLIMPYASLTHPHWLGPMSEGLPAKVVRLCPCGERGVLGQDGGFPPIWGPGLQ